MVSHQGSKFLTVRLRKHCKEQLFAMTRSVADLLSTLDRATKQQGDIPFDSRTDRELEDFENLLVEITSWIQRQSTENFLKVGL
jgi:hypothetical protein